MAEPGGIQEPLGHSLDILGGDRLDGGTVFPVFPDPSPGKETLPHTEALGLAGLG